MKRRLHLGLHTVLTGDNGRRGRQGRQRGIAAIELAFVLPVLLALVLGLVFYGLMFLVQQTLTMAAAEGSRAAIQYQPTIDQRVTAAQQTALNALPGFIRTRMGADDVAATSAPCTEPAGFQCVTVQIRFSLMGGANPFLPNIAFVPLPEELRATAISQLGTD